MKGLKYIALGIGAFFGGRYLFSLNRAKNKVLTIVTGQKESITAQGITIRVKYNIKNPTRANMKMTAPLIKLSFGGKLLASSTMKMVDIPLDARDESGRIVIKAFNETGEISTTILVPWLSVLGVSQQLLSRLQNQDPNEKIKLEIETTSRIYTLAGSYPFDELTTLTI